MKSIDELMDEFLAMVANASAWDWFYAYAGELTVDCYHVQFN